MEKFKLLLKVFAILFLLCFLEQYFWSVIFFAHLSTTSVCRPALFQQNYGDKFAAGATTYINATTKETNIIYYMEPSKGLIEHEQCHVRQYKQHRLFNCKLLIANEIECYTIQRWYELFE